MASLQAGSTGPAVVALQKALQAHGFSPGGTDGNFGPGTTQAVIGFQKSRSLTADGVAGPDTQAALGLSASAGPLPQFSVAVVSQMFPVTPVRNITANLPDVLSSLVAAQLTATPLALAALATIRAETESFEPISEFVSQFNTSPGGTPFNLYDHRADLGNQGPPDGASFKGRGYVQLTGRVNYTKFGPLVGADLVNNPDQANDPGVAANILSAFIGAKKSAIATALADNDLAAARRLVNGGSNGLDRFSSAFTIGQKLVGG